MTQDTPSTGGMRLFDLAQVIRSKNAGPFTLTLDVMFDDPAVYQRVADSGVLEPVSLARLYGVRPDQVDIIPFPRARAIKITMPRLVPSGDPRDNDVYATQQHVPLFDIEVPG